MAWKSSAHNRSHLADSFQWVLVIGQDQIYWEVRNYLGSRFGGQHQRINITIVAESASRSCCLFLSFSISPRIVLSYISLTQQDQSTNTIQTITPRTSTPLICTPGGSNIVPVLWLTKKQAPQQPGEQLLTLAEVRLAGLVSCVTFHQEFHASGDRRCAR